MHFNEIVKFSFYFKILFPIFITSLYQGEKKTDYIYYLCEEAPNSMCSFPIFIPVPQLMISELEGA